MKLANSCIAVEIAAPLFLLSLYIHATCQHPNKAISISIAYYVGIVPYGMPSIYRNVTQRIATFICNPAGYETFLVVAFLLPATGMPALFSAQALPVKTTMTAIISDVKTGAFINIFVSAICYRCRKPTIGHDFGK